MYHDGWKKLLCKSNKLASSVVSPEHEIINHCADWPTNSQGAIASKLTLDSSENSDWSNTFIKETD